MESDRREQGRTARRRRLGTGQGQDPVPGTLNPEAIPAAELPRAVARCLLAQHADRLPDLSGLTVLVPNHRAGLDFARVLARAAGRAALVPPRITPLKTWAEAAATGLPRPEPHARRLARLHGVLRGVDWLGAVDKWALASELLQLADDLSAARLGSGLGARLRHVHGGHLDRETALVETVWQALNGDGSDPSSCYARALDALLEQIGARPHAIYGYALGALTPAEAQFLERCAALAPLTLFEASHDAASLTLALSEAWGTSALPLRERAAVLAQRLPASPLLGAVKVCAAPHLEGEARAVVAWVGEQLRAGRRDIALIALDRETARRVRALLERLDVLAADETGWTLSTTAAAAVVDRWLECVANEFPHVEMLDLLKSPFLLGTLPERQGDVLRFELALRRAGVSQGLADLQRVAQQQFGALPRWLGALFDARQGFARSRATLATWLARLTESLARLDAIEPLNADAAGASLLGTLASLGRDLDDDDERYTFSEWRRWLNLALESASFVDARVASPVVLTSLPAARGRRFEAVAVIGCDARRLPPAPRPGLFSQATRAQLGLATAADDAREASADLLRLLAQGPALLSWQAWHEDEPNPASALVLRLQALHRAAWGTALDEQASAEPPTRASVPPGPAAAPHPVVPAARLPRRYSPTAYQTLLDCPYRFFVTGVLGIRELDEADDALDKSDYGNALHRILKAFHDSDPEPRRDAALERLDAVSALEFAALPAYTATAWGTRWKSLQPAYVDAWLAWHGEGWRYRSGEVEFSATVAVEGLGEVTLHGRVDRVDVRVDATGDEALAVIDFKTGAAQALKRRLGDAGEAVQLPFYAWLASAAAAYLPVNEAPVAPLALGGETDVDAIVRRLPALLEAIAAGTPLPAGGVYAVCHYCEVRGVCRKGTWETPQA